MLKLSLVRNSKFASSPIGVAVSGLKAINDLIPGKFLSTFMYGMFLFLE
jgi:hypothetical protein